MARVIAIANQKGGVAKTTTVAALGAALVDLGQRVVLVDLDAQACLTFAVGVHPDDVVATVTDVLVRGVPVREAMVDTADGARLLPADVTLAGVDSALLDRPERDLTLRRALMPVADEVDVVLIDCSPSLGVLTLNALAAADTVVVPMTADMLSHRGVGQVLDTVADVKRLLNPGLRVAGVLATMVDIRTAHARAVLDDVTTRYDVELLAAVPRSIRVAESAALGRSVIRTSPRSRVTQVYRDVARILISR